MFELYLEEMEQIAPLTEAEREEVLKSRHDLMGRLFGRDGGWDWRHAPPSLSRPAVRG